MKVKFLSALAITALLFASCSNDDEGDNQPNDGRVQFSSGMSAMQTRVAGAAGNEWEGNEAIGIFMVENGNTTVVENADNMRYTTTSVGTTAIFNSTTPIYYPVAGAKVDFFSYHPYAAVSNYEYAINVANQTSQSNIDLMVAKATNGGAGFDKTNTNPVNLVFTHQLTKVKINVVAGDGVSNLSGLVVNMKGMNTTADFNLISRTISNEATPADITPAGSGAVLEAILLPVDALDASHVVDFTVGGDTYKWVMNLNDQNIDKLEKGKIYEFSITITKMGVDVTASIAPWEQVGVVANGIAN